MWTVHFPIFPAGQLFPDVKSMFQKKKKILYCLVKNNFFPLGKSLVSCIPRSYLARDTTTLCFYLEEKKYFFLFLKHCFTPDNGWPQKKVSLYFPSFHSRAGNKVLCNPALLLYTPAGIIKWNFPLWLENLISFFLRAGL